MPLYFFDIRDGTTHKDLDGTDLADVAAAQAHAMLVAAAYAGDPAMLGSGGGAIIVEVHDAARAKLLTVRLAFGVEIHDAGPAAQWVPEE